MAFLDITDPTTVLPVVKLDLEQPPPGELDLWHMGSDFNKFRTALLEVHANIRGTTPPLTPTSDGRVGQVAFDANFLYVCVADNTWRRVALASW